MKKAAMLAMTMVLTGCASAPIAAFNMDGLRNIEFAQLCEDYHTLRIEGRLRPRAQEQLETVLLEKGLPERDLESARNGRIFIGMTWAGLYAAWGKSFEQNRSVGIWGEHVQHVYGSTYVYTENGVVTSWQD